MCVCVCVCYSRRRTVVRRAASRHLSVCRSACNTALRRPQSTAPGSCLLDQRWIQHSARLTKVFQSTIRSSLGIKRDIFTGNIRHASLVSLSTVQSRLECTLTVWSAFLLPRVHCRQLPTKCDRHCR